MMIMKMRRKKKRRKRRRGENTIVTRAMRADRHATHHAVSGVQRARSTNARPKAKGDPKEFEGVTRRRRREEGGGIKTYEKEVACFQDVSPLAGINSSGSTSAQLGHRQSSHPVAQASQDLSPLEAHQFFLVSSGNIGK